MALRQTLDYIDGRTNIIKAWLESFPLNERESVKAKLDIRLAYVRTLDRIPNTYMEKLKGKDDGIYEIKVEHGNVPYRILSCHGPLRAQVTMLFVATEHNDRLRPPNARSTARTRKSEIHLPGRVTLHDY